MRQSLYKKDAFSQEKGCLFNGLFQLLKILFYKNKPNFY